MGEESTPPVLGTCESCLWGLPCLHTANAGRRRAPASYCEHYRPRNRELVRCATCLHGTCCPLWLTASTAVTVLPPGQQVCAQWAWDRHRTPEAIEEAARRTRQR